MLSKILFLTGLLYAGVQSLEDYDHFREGACLPMPPHHDRDRHHQPQRWGGGPPQQPQIDPTWVDTLRYNSAGSKYHMFKMASPSPRYHKMSYDEFYYEFCYMRNTSSQYPLAAGFGFGQILETWDISTPNGYYIEAAPRTFFPRADIIQQRITMTDNKSFAFLVNCFPKYNQKSWNIVSNTPKLSPQARKMIEEHAESLGFEKKNFVFLRYDSCEKPSWPPTPGHQYQDQDRWDHHHHERSPPHPTQRPTTTTWKPRPTTKRYTTPLPPPKQRHELKRVTLHPPTTPGWSSSSTTPSTTTQMGWSKEHEELI